MKRNMSAESEVIKKRLERLNDGNMSRLFQKLFVTHLTSFVQIFVTREGKSDSKVI
jgi:hypothetical protein